MPVVGRRTPTGDSLSRASALNRLDLPLPVLPASATTVWSWDSASRLPARSTRVCAATRSLSGRYGSVTRRNRCSASSRSTSCCGVDPVVARSSASPDPLDEAHDVPDAVRGQREFLPGRSTSAAACRSVGARLELETHRGGAVGEPGRLRVEQHVNPGQQILAGPRRQRADRLVAEDRLEHLLRGDRGARPDRDLGAGRDERRRREHRDHHGQADGVDRVRGAAGHEPLVAGLRCGPGRAPHCCQSRTSRSARCGRSAEPASAARAPAGRPRPGGPATPSTPARPHPTTTPRSSVTSCDSSATCRLRPGAGRPVTAATTRSRSWPTLDSSAAQELAGADELLPARQHLAAQQPPVLQAVLHGAPAVAVGRIDPLVQGLGRDGLLVGGGGEPVDRRAQRGQRAVERLPHHGRPGVGVRRELREPVVQRPGHVLGQQSLTVQSGLRQHEQRRRGHVVRGEHLAQVGGDLAGGLGRHAVQHQRDHRAAQPGGASATPTVRRPRSAPRW